MFGLSDLFGVLVHRKYIILWSVVVATLCAVATGYFLPQKYQSTAKVQVDSLKKDNLTGLYEPRVRVVEFLGQQAAVAGSRKVALRVIDDLSSRGFLQLADYEEQWRKETGGEAVSGNDLRLWAADELLQSIKIDADGLESTLAISYSSGDPAEAARIANAFAAAYIDAIQEQKQNAFARNAISFSGETQSIAEEVEIAKRDLAEFREQAGIVPIGVLKVEAAEVEFSAITERLAKARADNSEAQSLWNLAQSSPSSELISFPIPANMVAAHQAQIRLGRTISKLNRLGDRYGDNYPDYIEAQREKESLEATILSAIRERADLAERNVASIEDQASEVKERVVAAQRVRDDFRLLENKLKTSEDTFDLVSTRSLEESLQSRVDAITVELLARAVPPSGSTALPLALIGLLGTVVGLALGAMFATIVEFQEARVRSEAAMRQMLKARSFGVIDQPAAPNPSARRRRSKKSKNLPRNGRMAA